MKNDHTLNKYLQIVDMALTTGYETRTMYEFHTKGDSEMFFAIRHDVDRKPKNALAMAKAEAERGVKASYYFRSVPASHDADIIEAIRDMGHEIGYHYEDWHLAKYDPAIADKLFRQHLERLQGIADIKTVCMHGSPLSSRNNLEFWDHFNPSDYDVVDCIINMNYAGTFYITDAGRTWGQTKANLRDEAPGAAIIPDIDSSDDLMMAMQTGNYPRIVIGCHPERWATGTGDWTGQYAKDQLANNVKRVIRKVRG